MDYGVVLVAVVLLLAGVLAGLIVWLRRRLPAEVLVEIEAVAAAIRATLGELATEGRVRWMAEYAYDLAQRDGTSRVSREEFADLVWAAVQRALDLEQVAMEAAGALGMGAGHGG